MERGFATLSVFFIFATSPVRFSPLQVFFEYGHLNPDYYRLILSNFHSQLWFKCSSNQDSSYFLIYQGKSKEPLPTVVAIVHV